MSQDILNEVYFLFGSVLIGIVITFVYDFILIGRRLIRHNIFFVSVEDLLFWIACAILVFYMLYEENNGILRWFAVFGAALGMLLYKKVAGQHFVNIMSTIIGRQIRILQKTAAFVFRPIKWILAKIRMLFRFLFKKEKKLAKVTKKKLTVYLKMLKITLCKH